MQAPYLSGEAGNLYEVAVFDAFRQLVFADVEKPAVSTYIYFSFETLGGIACAEFTGIAEQTEYGGAQPDAVYAAVQAQPQVARPVEAGGKHGVVLQAVGYVEMYGFTVRQRTDIRSVGIRAKHLVPAVFGRKPIWAADFEGESFLYYTIGTQYESFAFVFEIYAAVSSLSYLPDFRHRYAEGVQIYRLVIHAGRPGLEPSKLVGATGP